MTITEVRTKWEGEVINGAFPLRRFLGGSSHSAVFLTEHQAQNLPDAAIKIVPADPVLAPLQLLRWRTATALSHPHLVRLLDAGRCQLEGRQFLFVVMEYAEQTLSQILPHRALTSDEVREILPPTLDALAFLHGKNLVQGQLKPPNLLVIQDVLKLASDTIRPADESATSIDQHSMYDPPEAKNGRISAAGDIWALGVTLVEALTQCLPAWPDQRSETASLPANFPSEFEETVRGCLRRNPADRPTITDFYAQVGREPQAPATSNPPPVADEPPPVADEPPLVADEPPLVADEPPPVADEPPLVAQEPPPVAREEAGPATPSPKLSIQRLFVPIAAVLLVILIAVWTGSRLFLSSPDSRQAVSMTSRTSSQPAATEEPAPSSRANGPTQPPAGASSSVLHKEIPVVSQRARDTIHGHINVSVRVTVDSSGNVVEETLEHPGPSKYFARLATAAARKWKFSPSANQQSRDWLLRFDFARSGTTGEAAARE